MQWHSVFARMSFNSYLCVSAPVFFASLLALLAVSVPANAESILQVLPTRVVLEGPLRSKTVTLINRGDEDGNYRMFFRNIRANERGEFSEVIEPIAGELFSEKMVRFSPRRITVPARSKQSIRVVLRKPKDLADGEYRSHMVFRKLPAQNSVLDKEAGENEVGFTLRPIVEVTIPVIVRHGELAAELTLSDAKILPVDDIQKNIEFTIHRDGNRSLYGDVDAWWVTADGEKKNVGMARGVSVYVPNDKRIFKMPLDAGEKALRGGKILLEYKEDSTYGGDQDAALEVSL